jgi:DNA-directed RNA polymerase subunit N (RpoN/RPB10)
MAYFNRKVSGYKKQDTTTGRLIPKEFYVTAEELESYANGKCFSCGTHLYLDFKDGNVITNITADRIDNDIGHQLDNIRPCCRACNCALSNKNSN